MLVFAVLAGCGSGSSSPQSQSTTPPAPTITVSGTVLYEDPEYDNSGFTGTLVTKAVRYADVDLLNGSGQILASTTTDATGAYTISGAGSSLSIRVLALSSQYFTTDLSVNNLVGEVYAVSQTVDTTNATAVTDITITHSSTIAGAFNMLDVMNTAAEFVGDLAVLSLPQLAVYWNPGNSNYGTYYCVANLGGSQCPRGAGIYAVGGRSIGGNIGGDTDQFDDDVLWHEFSHYLEEVLSIDDSPGGAHAFTQYDLDLRLAWSEGWGNFFATAVKAWASSTNPALLSTTSGLVTTQYVDTIGTLTNNPDVRLTLDIENPGLCGSFDCYIYSSNEIAIAKILSVIKQSYAMNPIWNVYQNYFSTLTTNPVNMESFWDGLLFQLSPDSTLLFDLASIYSERQIYFQQDSFESAGDDGIDPSRLLTATETHYIYHNDGTTDTDIIAFNATQGQTYTIETIDLKNGADTYLTILDSSGSPALDGSGTPITNDDRNDTCSSCINDALSYSSLINFSPTTTDIFYVKVDTSPLLDVGSGRYGSYSIKITLQ